MKRRDFLKKAGLAITAAPILAHGIKATTAKVIPSDPTFFPEKYLFDPPEVVAQCRKSEPGRVFTDLDQQTRFLQRHFAKHIEWQEFTDKWINRSGEVIVCQSSSLHTCVNFLGWYMYVNLGAIITTLGDEIRILTNAPSGNELDWRWRPAQAIGYEAGHGKKLLLASGKKRPQIGDIIGFMFGAGPMYTIIESSPLAERYHCTEVYSVLLDRPLESSVHSDKHFIVNQWQSVMRPILDQNLRTVTLG